MALNNAEKEFYVTFIKAVYGNSLYVQESDITQGVADICDKMMTDIKNCSIKFATANVFFSVIYPYPSLNAKIFIVKFALSAALNGKKWIDSLMGNRQYRACVVTAAANYRSMLQMELMDI